MSRKDRFKEAFAALDALYNRLPKIECQGLCYTCCGPIFMSEMEHVRLARANGGEVPFYDAQKGFCPFLDEEHRCSKYRERPFICRLYGLTPHLRCEHGCQPERFVTDQEIGEFVREIETISGSFEERWIMPERWHEYREANHIPAFGNEAVRMPYLRWIEMRKKEPPE